MAKKKTVAQWEAQCAALEAQVEGLKVQLEAQRSRMRTDYIERSEYNRVQAVLRSTQQFMRKYKDEARPSGDKPVSDRRAAMDAAKAQAMATGATVAVPHA